MSFIQVKAYEPCIDRAGREARILDVLRLHQPLSLRQISEAVGLAKSSYLRSIVTDLVLDELIEYEVADVRGTKLYRLTGS